jgi:hypothetical protein
LISVYNHGSQTYEKVKKTGRESSVCCQFFHENHWFFKVFEIPETDVSLILNFFSKNLNCRLSGTAGSLKN